METNQNREAETPRMLLDSLSANNDLSTNLSFNGSFNDCRETFYPLRRSKSGSNGDLPTRVNSPTKPVELETTCNMSPYVQRNSKPLNTPERCNLQTSFEVMFKKKGTEFFRHKKHSLSSDNVTNATSLKGKEAELVHSKKDLLSTNEDPNVRVLRTRSGRTSNKPSSFWKLKRKTSHLDMLSVDQENTDSDRVKNCHKRPRKDMNVRHQDKSHSRQRHKL